MVAFTPAMAFTSSAHAAAFKVSPTKATVYVGKYKTLKSTKTAKWTSSKKSVAKLTASKGKTVKVKGLKAGKATITAKYGKKSVKVKVTVKKAVAKTALTAVTVTDTTSQTATVTAGDTLVANTTPSGATATYQWYADGTAIAGATDHSYTVESAYVGKAITVKATGVDKYKGTVESTATAKVLTITMTKVSLTKPNSTAGAAPISVVAGSKATVGVGDVLTAAGLTAADKAVNDCTYQWYLNGTAAANQITGATTQTYTVTKSDVGKTVSCIITPKTGVTCTMTEAARTVTSEAVSNTVSVSITNKAATINTELKTALSPAAAADSVTYQWYKDGLSIPSATSATYTPTTVGTYKVVLTLKTGEQTYALDKTNYEASIKVVKSAIDSVKVVNGTAVTSNRTNNVFGDVLTANAVSGSTTLKYTGDYTIDWYSSDDATLVTEGTGADTKIATDSQTLDTSKIDAAKILGKNIFAVATGANDFAKQVKASDAVTGFSTALTGIKVASTANNTYTATVTPAEAVTAKAVTYQWMHYATVGGSVATATKCTGTGAATATYTANADDAAMTIYCVATGTGNYTGTLTSNGLSVTSTTAISGTISYTGTTAGAAKVTVDATKLVGTATYTIAAKGTANTGTATVSSDGTLDLSKAKANDTYTVTATGTGNYSGTVSVDITIS